MEFLTPFKMTKGKVRTFESFLCLLRWARRSLCPESTSRRRLFEQSEFLSHLIWGRGGGTPLGPRTGKNST